MRSRRPALILVALVALTLSTSPALTNAAVANETGVATTTPRPSTNPTTTTNTGIQPIIQDPSKPPRRIWSGWLPYYSMRTSLPSALNNNDLIREVMLFWFTLKGPTRILDLYKGGNPSIPMDTPLSQLRAAGYLLIPTITDGMGKLELQQVLAKPKQRTQTVATIMDLVRSKNFDGIDLDLEGFAFVDGTSSWNKTRPLWVEFVKELSTALKAEGKLLSVTTPVSFDPASGRRGYWVYDWPGIAPYIDRLRIMTYDYATSRPGPIGPLFWAEDAVKYATSVMPASKVFMGVAGYGRDWVTKVDGTCPKDVANIVKAGAKASTFVMRDAPTLVARYGANAQYKVREGEVNFTYQRTYTGVTAKGNPTTCTATRTAWYQDPRGYMARAQLVEKYRLGGLVAWTIGMEESNAMLAVRGVAQQIAPDVVKADLTIDRPVIRFGEYVRVNARFTLPDKLPAANIPTTIQMKSGAGAGTGAGTSSGTGSGSSSGTGAWRDIYKGVTNSDGVVTINSLLGNQVQFRAISEGSWERLASTSSEVEVKVNPSLSLAGPSISYLGRSETYTATLTPIATAKTILLERFDPKKNSYVEIARSKVEPMKIETSEVEPKTRAGETSLSKGVATFVIPMSDLAKGATSTTQFSRLRARLLVKDQPASSANVLVSSTLWITTLKP